MKKIISARSKDEIYNQESIFSESFQKGSNIQILDKETIKTLNRYSVLLLTQVLIEKVKETQSYVCDMGIIQGEKVSFSFKCQYPPEINLFYESIEGEGFKWLQSLGLIPLDSDIKQSDFASYEKITKIRKTNSDLLAAATLPKADRRGLLLANKVNMWLFMNDNLFDHQDSPFSKNYQLSESVYNAYEQALQSEEPVAVPILVPAIHRQIIQQLIHGIADIRRDLIALSTSLDIKKKILEYVLESFVAYKAGNLKECVSRKSELTENQGIPMVSFFDTRDSAGAVELVFRISDAISDAIISKTENTDIMRDFEDFSRLCKFHICEFNDCTSAPKEAVSHVDQQNFLLKIKEGTKTNWTQASKCVEEDVNSIMARLNEIEANLNEKLKTCSNESFIDNLRKKVYNRKCWLVGHMVWELVCFEGRHPKNAIIKETDIAKFKGTAK